MYSRLTDLVLALIYAFGERWFPRPLHALGRWIAIYSLEDNFLNHVRIEPLTGAKKAITHFLLKGLCFTKRDSPPMQDISLCESENSNGERTKEMINQQYSEFQIWVGPKVVETLWGLVKMSLSNTVALS